MQLSLALSIRCGTGEGSSIALSPDGRALATSHRQESDVSLWDTRTGQKSKTFEIENAPNWLAFSPDGKILATGGDGAVVLWDVSTRRQSTLLDKGFQARISFSPDGAVLAMGGASGRVRVWDVGSRRELSVLDSHPVTNLHNFIVFSGDGELLAAGTRVWETRNWKETHTFALNEDFADAFAFAPDGRTAALGTNHGVFQLWDIVTWRQLSAIDRQSGAALSMDFSPDGKLLAAGSGNGTLRVWETGSYREVATVIAHPTRYDKYGHVTHVKFFPDSLSIASNGWDGVPKIWLLA